MSEEQIQELKTLLDRMQNIISKLKVIRLLLE